MNNVGLTYHEYFFLLSKLLLINIVFLSNRLKLIMRFSMTLWLFFVKNIAQYPRNSKRLGLLMKNLRVEAFFKSEKT